MPGTDERVQQVKRKVTSTGFLILSWGLMAILLYRSYGLGQGFEQIRDIFALWLVGNAYVAIASTVGGVQPFDARRGSIWLVPLIMAAIMVAIQALVGRMDSIAEAAVGFVVAFAVSFLLFLGLQALYLRWERRNLG